MPTLKQKFEESKVGKRAYRAFTLLMDKEDWGIQGTRDYFVEDELKDLLDFFLSEQKQRDERIIEAVENIKASKYSMDDGELVYRNKILQIIKTIE